MKRDGIFLDEWNTPRIGWGVSAVLGVIFSVLYVLCGVISHIDLPAQRAGIEQVRIDVARTGCSAAEDAIGLAIEQNRTIKSYRYWAHHWLTGLAIPNGWDDITVIEIPDCR